MKYFTTIPRYKSSVALIPDIVAISTTGFVSQAIFLHHRYDFTATVKTKQC
ncbi:MAG: hypothetical protein JST75_18680 [Bacteroidetes bacterium]|nr:hypothetical protein [Bacteroidota bacterium]